jgi:hypothetical protein
VVRRLGWRVALESSIFVSAAGRNPETPVGLDMVTSCAADPAQVAARSRAMDRSSAWRSRHQPHECGVVCSPSSVAAREFAMIPAGRHPKPKIALAPLWMSFGKSLGKTSPGGACDRCRTDKAMRIDGGARPSRGESFERSLDPLATKDEIRDGGNVVDRRMR